MFQNIWLILTGSKRELDQVNEKLDKMLVIQHELFNDYVVILSALEKIQAALSPPPAVALEIEIGGVTKGDKGMLQVKDTGSVLFTLKVLDAKKNPTTLDAPAIWKSSDESIMTLNVAEDGLTAVGVLSGTLGTVSAHIEGKAGELTLAKDSDQIEINPDAASVLEVSVSAQ